MYMLQKKDQGRVPVALMVVTRSGKHYLPSFSTESAGFEKIVWSEIASKDR